jgi:hypothetical protein
MSCLCGVNRPAARSSSKLLGIFFSVRQRATRPRHENQDRFRARIGSLALSFAQLDCWSHKSATDAKMLPQPKPRAVRQILIVPSIGSHEVECGQRSRVGRRENALQTLDFGNSLLGVHAVSISSISPATVKWTASNGVSARACNAQKPTAR